MSSAVHILGAAVAISAVLYLPGAAWCWALRPASRVEAAALSLAFGLCVILLPLILLAETGCFSTAAIATWAALVTLAGVFAGRLRSARDATPGGLVLLAGLAILLSLPQRGEWLAGGWDPGVNLNQGLLLARTGAVEQPPDPLRAAALQQASDAFARESFGFVEAFPGVPADPETGALRAYFYRATPTLVALLDTVAGRAAALRANHVAGWIACLLFAGALAACATPTRASLVIPGVVLFALQPLFLAHVSLPASEILELAVICATGLLLARRNDCPSAILLAAVLTLGALNRVSFLFHQALLLLLLVCGEARDSNRSAVAIRHLAVACSLTAGLAWYTWVSPESLQKLRHLQPALLGLAAASVAAALAVDGALLHRRRGAPAWTQWALAAVPLIFIARESLRHEAWIQFAGNLPAWIAYTGPLLLIAAAVGLFLAARRLPLALWLCWLATALFAALIHRHAAELYPWATKRWMPWTVPLLATGAAALVHAACAVHRPWSRGLGIGLALVLCAVTLSPALRAWRSTEYNGSAAALDRLAATLRPDDLVLADHFLWGTPLALAHGFTVLNAEPLLAGLGNPDRVPALLRQSGRRVVLVTSTSDALRKWPAPLTNAVALADPIAFTTRERIQHRSQRGFSTRERTFVLQAHAWEPTP